MKIEFLNDNLKNKNFWIGHANATANILFAFNGIFIFWMAKEVTSREISHSGYLVTCFLVLSFLSLVALLFVIFPRLGSKTSSLYYFGGIQNQSKAEFMERVRLINDATIIDELSSQIYINSEIAHSKFWWIRLSIIFTVGNILFAILLQVAF